MAGLAATLMRKANDVHVALYRRSRGRRFNTVKGRPILLLTVNGRTTGTPRTNPVAYLQEGASWVVAGSGGGSTAEPQWFRNLRRADRAAVEIGDVRTEVGVQVAEGAAYDDLWQKLIDVAPFFDGYRVKSGRVIPLAVLSPV